MKFITLIAALLLLQACRDAASQRPEQSFSPSDEFVYDTAYRASRFDFPVGKPDAKGYYNAQKFGKNTHLGDDWNGLGGGNTDLGDTVYAIANGYITFAEDIYGGWGNVVRILHQLPPGKPYDQVESLYAHLDTIFAQPQSYVRIGTPVGTIGTNHGQYYAHLHLELRHIAGLPIGGGYSTDTTGYLDPTRFIKANRK